MKRILIPVSLCAASAAHAEDLKADGRGLTFEQGELTLNLGGRIHFDAAVFDDPANARSGVTDAAFRRARLELSGKVGEHVRFRLDREFAGGSKGWRNVWAGLSPAENFEIRGGNMMVPFSGEDLQSSNSIPFAERSLASGLAPGYGLGALASVSGARWSATGGWFTDALDNEDGRSVERGRGVVGRVSVLPVSQGKTRLHLGFGGERRSFRSGEAVRFSADPGSALAPGIMSSGSLGNLRHLTGWSGEAGLSFGSLLVQAQVLGTTISRIATPSLNFAGQSMQASLLLNGRGYGYAQAAGAFSGPDRKRGSLVVELAGRFSRLDLRDGAFDRGIGKAFTGGANLYIGRNLRLMADVTRTEVDFAGATPDRTNTVAVTRLQVNF
jgi:phosphate-selective porin OprO/OprP